MSPILTPEVPRPRWLAVAVPLFLLWLAAEVLHHTLAPYLPFPVQLLASALVLTTAVAILHRRVIAKIAPFAQKLRRQNDELLALHEAGLVVTADLTLETVLRSIVDRATRLIGTRYGALAVIGEEGTITTFVTTGLDDATRAQIGAPPRGSGLLGVPLHSGESLRLTDVAADPRAVGFPPNHPPMKSLLAVPVPGRGRPHGNLYLSEKEDGSPFTAADEETLARFALQARVAIENALLHERTLEIAAARERLRLASEMYDGTAQVVAYVNTKTQVVREHCRQGRSEEALRHLDQLAAVARDIYAAQRARILDLKALDSSGRPTATEAIADHLRAWSGETAVAVDMELPPAVDIAPEVELQMLRILQEGLDNVRRHAHASKVSLSLRQSGDRLLLEVADDGVGFDPGTMPSTSGAPHLGLPSMRERATALGGRLEVMAAPGAGTRLLLELPAEANHATAHR